MPTIKFKLKDPKYCNGCPCLHFFSEEGCRCGHSFNVFFDYVFDRTKRPQSCIDKFGE